MTTVTSKDARNRFGDIINMAAYARERTIITRRGKRMAAITSVEEFYLLNAVLDELEEHADAEYCRNALENLDLGQTVPWEEIKSALGVPEIIRKHRRRLQGA